MSSINDTKSADRGEPWYYDSRLLGLRGVGGDLSELFSDNLQDLVSPTDGRLLEAVYDLSAISSEIDRDRIASVGSMWAWNFLLPQRDPSKLVSMTEGGTPLVKCQRLAEDIGVRSIYIKDEGRNPTGSFKDRGSSVTVSKCKEIGHTAIVVASSGNLACSLAAYCARAGLTFYGLIRDDTTDILRLHTAITGQKIQIVEGNMLDGVKLAKEIAARFGFFHAVQPYNLYRVEGKKTLAFEIAQDLDWRMPDRILVPTSGCTNALALHKGFAELLEIGWIDKVPAIDLVQPTGCAPVVEAWRGDGSVERSGGPGTSLLGLGHPFPAAGDQAVEVMKATGGAGLTATDEDSYGAGALIAETEGLYLQPASAIPVAALKNPENAAYLAEVKDQTLVVIGTATGKNHLHEPLAHLSPLPRITGGIAEFIALNPDLRDMTAP